MKTVNKQPAQALRPIRRKARPSQKRFIAWKLRLAKEVIEHGGRVQLDRTK